MSVSRKSLVLRVGRMFVLMAIVLFGAAGTLRWAAGWAFLLSFTSFVIAVSAWLARHDPELLRERMAGFGAVEQAWDRKLLAFALLLFAAWLIAMPLDAVRYRWSSMSGWLRITGACLLLLSYCVFFATFAANSYLSPGVRVQAERGHEVVSAGPYAYVRHPMYAGLVLFVIGSSLMLGSWVGVAGAAGLIGVVARRAVLEERLLREQLPGYQSYMSRVKYRLLPGLW